MSAPWLPPAPAAVRALTPMGAAAVAVAAGAGALAARPLTLLVPAALAGIVVLSRRPALLALPVALAASALGARALDGLAPPPPGPVAGTATLVTDPEGRWGTVEAVARLGRRHVLLRAESAAGEILAARLAGERVIVAGSLRPLPDDMAFLRMRHVAAEVRVRSARAGPDAVPPWRAANHLRRLLDRGAAPLGDQQQALYLGLVLGDDRAQAPETVDDFRGSGLAHLLAVSGQNVAFVLALAGPGLTRLPPGGRLVVMGALLGLFAVVTRCEPSVLRAVAMAAAGAAAAARGRPTAGVQLLALAVTALVLIDPLLVRSLGFQLSVAATLGILVIGPRLRPLLPGPEALRAAVTVSVSAQLAVAPLLLGSFGGVPVASLPANVLAAPAAAVVLTWGLPAGLAAGALGGPWDGWLHLPTGIALGALGTVARRAASVPFGELGPVHLAVVAGGLGALLVTRRCEDGGDATAMAAPDPRGPGPRPGLVMATSGWPRLVLRTAGLVALAGAVAAPAVALGRAPPVVRPHPGVTVWRAGGAAVAVVDPGTGSMAVLEGLRRAGVVDLDLLVLGPGATPADEERAARHRARVGRVWILGRDPAGGATMVRVGPITVSRQAAGEACVRLPADPPCDGNEPDRSPERGR